jgi:hypothetical protein
MGLEHLGNSRHRLFYDSFLHIYMVGERVGGRPAALYLKYKIFLALARSD